MYSEWCMYGRLLHTVYMVVYVWQVIVYSEWCMYGRLLRTVNGVCMAGY